MFDQFARLDEAHLVFLGVMGTLTLIAVTILAAVMAVQFRKLRQKELELGFKDELLLRGYSVDEAIRLVSSRKPGWSHGLITTGDWIGGKLRIGTDRLVRLMRRTAISGESLLRDLWNRAQPTARQLRKQSGPWLQKAVTRLNRGVHWLAGKTEDLTRRLVGQLS